MVDRARGQERKTQRCEPNGVGGNLRDNLAVLVLERGRSSGAARQRNVSHAERSSPAWIRARTSRSSSRLPSELTKNIPIAWSAAADIQYSRELRGFRRALVRSARGACTPQTLTVWTRGSSRPKKTHAGRFAGAAVALAQRWRAWLRYAFTRSRVDLDRGTCPARARLVGGVTTARGA